jgi:transcriptional regulator with XRE-family HTH domain
LREKASLTQKQLAEILKVGRGAVARWELGGREPEDRNYSALADVAKERDLSELEDFFHSRSERRRHSREENEAMRYLAAVEKDAANGQKDARRLLRLCELPQLVYYKQITDEIDRARAASAEAVNALVLITRLFEEAWRVTTLQLGRMCRDKKNAEARLRSDLEALERASPQNWQRR